MPTKNPKAKSVDYEQLGKMLSNIYETGYIDRNQAYKMSFVKGLFAGLGGVVGATILVALVLWILTLFDSIPLIGPLTLQIQNAVESSR